MEKPEQRLVCHPLPDGVEGDTGIEDIPALLEAARSELIDGLVGVFREQAAVSVNFASISLPQPLPPLAPLRRRPGWQCPIPGCFKHRADGTPVVVPSPR